MLIRLSQCMNRSQTCAIIFSSRFQLRPFSYSARKQSKQLKQVSSESPSNSQLSTSFKEKAKDNVKTGGYGLVVIGGLGLLAVVFGTIFKVNSRSFSNDYCVKEVIFRNYSPQTVPTICMTELSRSVRSMSGWQISWVSPSKPSERRAGVGGGTE